jgi:hypothetical protein
MCVNSFIYGISNQHADKLFGQDVKYDKENTQTVYTNNKNDEIYNQPWNPLFTLGKKWYWRK